MTKGLRGNIEGMSLQAPVLSSYSKKKYSAVESWCSRAGNALAKVGR